MAKVYPENISLKISYYQTLMLKSYNSDNIIILTYYYLKLEMSITYNLLLYNLKLKCISTELWDYFYSIFHKALIIFHYVPQIYFIVAINRFLFV